jgi:hypothetical protein
LHEKSAESTRRKFFKMLATTAAAVGVGIKCILPLKAKRIIIFEQLKRTGSSANDKINIALIGAGGMGVQDTLTALKVPGVKLVAILRFV